MSDWRVETDSMGDVRIPAAALYGAQTARAAHNFQVSNRRFSRPFLRALGLIKQYAARVNGDLQLLPTPLADAIAAAAAEVVAGKWDSEFVVDIFQTGSGTSTNMNANEVIANRAAELLGRERGSRAVHPNDHVNRGQSSNDVIPSALHVAALEQLQRHLIPALQELQDELDRKTAEFHDLVKIGRTHLQDATPMTLGQEFSGYATQVAYAIRRLSQCQPALAELALGGTAVGTGLNAPPGFAARVIAGISEDTGLPFREARNHFEAQGARDAAVELSGALKTVAVSLARIANDVRLLGSGPRLGLGEITLPALQPGSSIMPGKVNPVMPEMLLQVCAQVIGNDAVITFAGTQGQLELNAMIPVIAHNLLESVEILGNAARTFARGCIAGLRANQMRLAGNIEQSLALCTALVPAIGYDRAAEIAKKAHETGRTIRSVAAELSGLSAAELDVLLDPRHALGRDYSAGQTLEGRSPVEAHA